MLILLFMGGALLALCIDWVSYKSESSLYDLAGLLFFFGLPLAALVQAVEWGWI